MFFLIEFFRIQKNSNIPFSKILFFDDEFRNIKDVTALGVLCILVENGMNMKVLKSGLKQYEVKESKSG